MLQTPKCYERRCRQFAGVAQPDGDESSERPICRAFPNGIPAIVFAAIVLDMGLAALI